MEKRQFLNRESDFMMSSSSSNINMVDACEFCVSNKAAGKKKVCDSNTSNSCSSIGVDLQRTKSFPTNKTMMMLHCHHDNHHRPSPSYEICCADLSGLTNNTSAKTSSTDNYHAIASGFVSGYGFNAFQPFDIATAASSAPTQTAFKSPAMAASMGFPFTNAQWKELERQAMIYKYMMASVPVPPDLLFPITRNSSAPVGSGLNLIRFSNGGDLEPGRCRRTDGKKWRCSRDVAPEQKYCERHLNRGRPRSRKPVELPVNKKKSRLEPNPNTINCNNNSNNNYCPSPSQFAGTFSQYPHIQSPETATFQPMKEQRCLDWMMKGEHVQIPSSAGPEWHHLMPQQTAMDVNNSSVLTQRYLQQPLNLNTFANFNAGEDQFINPEPRGFIDAWSNGVSNDEQNANPGAKSSVSSGGNLTLSPLSLSMGGNNAIEEEMGQVKMGLALVKSGQDHECSTKPPLSSWLTPVSWAASTPGGPLAEVLRPRTVTASGPPSPTARNGDYGSPPATTMSSPCGVLQKTLASWSDSSGSGSPTLASSRTNKPEIALLWSSQGKLESSAEVEL